MANTFKKIQTVTVGSGGATTIDFQNIPATYTDLVILCSIRSDRASQQGSSAGVSFNNTTSNRTMRDILADGLNPSSGNDTQFYIRIPASTSTASIFGNAIIYIPNYLSANNKSVSIESVNENNATTAFMELMAGLWSDTSAINRITLTENNGANFVQYSTATLYGVANAANTSVGAYATGGNQIYTDNTYWYHVFTSDGTFTPTKALTCDYLVIAGGGGSGGGGTGGGTYGAGGSGAGGYRTTVGTSGGGSSAESALSLTATAYTVTVGGGGAGANGVSSNGSNSVFGSITSTGGGRGGDLGASGTTGGSGGGASTGTGSSGTANQGYAGGNGGTGSPSSGGGGGGAGGAGGNGSSSASAGGSAGVGLSSSISGTSVTRASGGIGGNSTTDNNGTNATNNTGDGGNGGGVNAGGNTTGGSGGSGIVIVRYAI